ncbi:MAG: hypothetical protein ABEH56_06795 [Salinirussus sp.]
MDGSSTWRRRPRSLLGAVLGNGLAVVGLASLTVAVVVLLRPDVLPVDDPTVAELIGILGSEGLVALGGAGVIASVALSLYRRVSGDGGDGSGSRSRVDSPVPYPPETPRVALSERPGSAFDNRLEAVGTGRGSRRERQLRATLERTAVDCLVAAEGCDEATARERVETGTWTDDPRAAAFLGGSGSRPPWWVELWDWLRPMPRVERRVRHTVAAVDTVADGIDSATATGDGGRA